MPVIFHSMGVSRRTLIAGSIAAIIVAGAIFLYARYRSPAEGWERYQTAAIPDGKAERAMKALFKDENVAAAARYDALFAYFLDGFLEHATPDYSAVHYNGWGSIYGWRVTGLEGFARTAPLFAAWVHSGRDPIVKNAKTGAPTDLVAILKTGLLAGTDKGAPSYWGDIVTNDQRIVESADVARVVWLTRAQIWDKLTGSERAQIAAWLNQSNRAGHKYQNNWLLFPIIVDQILYKLGARPEPADLTDYWAYKAAHRESGWFADPPEGVDFYTTWATAYELYWLHQLDPNLDSAFINNALSEAANLTSHLIGPQGIPILGRSICYRTAVSVPLLIDNLNKDTPETAGLAHRALDVTWRYFIAHGSLRDGALTQGYFGPDPRVVDAYTGPGSCHWGLRSLVLAFMEPPADAVWTSTSKPLPVETGDYRLELPKIGWTVRGTQASGNISILIPGNRLGTIRPERYNLLAQLKEFILRHPARPENHKLKYELREYGSLKPYPVIGLE